MTKSLVHQLQSEAIDDSASISGLLMKAKLVAAKLSLDDLTEWIEFELGGFPSREQVPSYRRFQCKPEAFNPYVGWIPIDFGTIPKKLMYEFSTIYMQESISSVEKHAVGSGKLEMRMPEMLTQLLYAGRDSEDRFKISWRFSANSLSGVLTAVRGRILTWSLDLEKQGILGEGVSFSFKEKEIASMVFKNDFNGAVINNNGVLASSTGDVTQGNKMNAGSFESLRDELKKIGLSDVEIDELHKAIENSEL
ncbi:AbiTii domain-containing protein [Rahnella selenatireducens]|uniref:AbiTii domain-containing protein n=1 Tax=Rahnella selenatireducens TaxID=3389797 RepID=UPI003968446E